MLPSPSTRSAGRHRRAGSARVSVALAALIGLMPAIAVAGSAQAAELDAITSVSIESHDTTVALKVWEQFTVNAEWSAPPGAQQGDTFSLAFPGPVIGFESTFELLDEDDVSVGSCVVGQNTFTCTLNDYVETHRDVAGSLYFFAQSSEEDSSGSLAFVTGTGVTIPVALPGGGIVVGEPGTAPTDPVKWGWLNSDGVSLTWQIFIPAEDLRGGGTEAVILTDSYDPRLRFDADSFRASWILASEWNSPHYTELSPGPDGYTLIDDPAGNSFTFTVNNPVFDAERMYAFSYTTVLPDDAKSGDVFENSLTANDAQLQSWPVEFLKAGGDGGGTPIPELGGFTVSKTVIGAAAASVDASTEYFVDYRYTLDGEIVNGSLTVRAGASTGVSDLPDGTVVSLSEREPAARAGVVWGTPFFGGADVTARGASASLTIAAGSTATVSLQNSAGAAVTPTPTPTPEETSPPATTPPTTPPTTSPSTAPPVTPSTSMPAGSPPGASPTSSPAPATTTLASTGSDPAPLAGAVLALLLLGSVMIAVARRSARQ